MIYLATPYSHEDPSIREERYLLAMDITQWFLKGFHTIFSPIVHCHPMACKYKLPKDHIFWLEHNKEWLEKADEVWFAMFPGYSMSLGMRQEFNCAARLQIRKRMVLPMRPDKWGEGKYIISNTLTRNFLDDPKIRGRI